MSDILRASRPRGRSRSPKTADTGRVCTFDGCDTILSKYNRQDFCNQHRPVKYPRLRGVLAE